MAFDEAQEILSEDFKDHADMGAVGTLVFKVVKEGYDVRSARMGV